MDLFAGFCFDHSGGNFIRVIIQESDNFPGGTGNRTAVFPAAKILYNLANADRAAKGVGYRHNILGVKISGREER